MSAVGTSDLMAMLKYEYDEKEEHTTQEGHIIKATIPSCIVVIVDACVVVLSRSVVAFVMN